MFYIRDQFKALHYNNTCSKRSNLTPSQCQIEVDPLSVICSKHFYQKNVHKDSFTQCPGEGGQEEVVQQGCYNLAGILPIVRKDCMQWMAFEHVICTTINIKCIKCWRVHFAAIYEPI